MIITKIRRLILKWDMSQIKIEVTSHEYEIAEEIFQQSED